MVYNSHAQYKASNYHYSYYNFHHYSIPTYNHDVRIDDADSNGCNASPYPSI